MGEIPSPGADMLNATADSGYDSEGNNSSWVFGRAKNRNDARKVGNSAWLIYGQIEKSFVLKLI